MSIRSYNPDSIREDFPILGRSNRGKPLVYLDNAATSQKPQVVIDAISKYYKQNNANVHRGVYELAEDAENLYSSARKRIASWLNISADELIFVRGATEGLNLIAHSFAAPCIRHGDQIILTEMEHHANIVPWQMMAESRDASIVVVPVLPDGSHDLEKLFSLLANERSKILSICHISNVLGTVNPIEDIIKEAHKNGVKVVVDGAQSVPHKPVNLRKMNPDFFVFSGHKVFGPMGIGVLFARKELMDSMQPYQGGGDMIDQVSFSGTTFASGQQRFEAGTPNVAGAIGLGEAIRYLQSFDFEKVDKHEKHLLQRTRDQLHEVDGLTEYGTTPDKAGVFCYSVENVHPHDLATLLDAEGIATRTGHHCCQPLMQKLGVVATARASFSIYNTKDDADRFASALIRAVSLLRS